MRNNIILRCEVPFYPQILLKSLTFYPFYLSHLIHRSLIEVFIFEKNANINLSYEFNHTYKVIGNFNKLVRVVSNIFSNAGQAMQNNGHIWIKTKDVKKGNKKFMEICIGNNLSHISKGDLAHLFDAFFTKNKKNGTGLGLAIAKKNVNEHGGEIWCKSSISKGVEFYFTLPVSEKIDIKDFRFLLPHTKEILENDVLKKEKNIEFK